MKDKEVLEILNQSTINENIIKLPPKQLERKQYLEVKRKLEGIGGKWKGGKIQGFVFEQDPSQLLYQIINGANINIKKDYQFYETPEDIAKKLVYLADISENELILEPSAGRGAIVKQITKCFPNKKIDCFEIMELNRSFLYEMGINFIGGDFLKCNITNYYDKIIANPPFRNNQDIVHIMKMYECLKIDGMIVSMASMHWTHSQNRREKNFRNWVGSIDARIIKLPSCTFKKSGANSESCIVIINKRKNDTNYSTPVRRI